MKNTVFMVALHHLQKQHFKHKSLSNILDCTHGVFKNESLIVIGE